MIEKLENLTIVLLGNSGVGKSSIVNRLQNTKFDPDIDRTVGATFNSKIIYLKGLNISLKINIWDTAGEERFNGQNKIFAKNADGYMIVYDITNYKSFENINKYYNLIKEISGEKRPIYLIGNKIDMYWKQEVSEELSEKKAKELNCSLFRLSPKTNYIFYDYSQLSCKSVHYDIDFDYLIEELAYTIYINKKGIENITIVEKDDYDNDNEKEKYKNYEKEKNKFNIVLIGDSNVGKTSFLEKISSPRKGIILSNRKKIIFYEIKEDYNDENLKEADGFLILYDTTDIKSFKNVNKYYDLIKKNSNEEIPFILIGTKSDKHWEKIISKKDGEELAKKIKSDFYEISLTFFIFN